jgi:hypothetical protein
LLRTIARRDWSTSIQLHQQTHSTTNTNRLRSGYHWTIVFILPSHLSYRPLHQQRIMTQISKNLNENDDAMMDEDNLNNDDADRQSTIEQFHAVMDAQNNNRNHNNGTSTVNSRIIQSDSIMAIDNTFNDADASNVDMIDQPQFPKLTLQQQLQNNNQSNGVTQKTEYRRIRCPTHRYTPLREHWEQILTPLVEYLKLQVRSLLINYTTINCEA